MWSCIKIRKVTCHGVHYAIVAAVECYFVNGQFVWFDSMNGLYIQWPDACDPVVDI